MRANRRNQKAVMKALSVGHTDSVRTTKVMVKVRLLGSGPILKNVIMASEKLRDRGIATEIWSVTSYGELRRGLGA